MPARVVHRTSNRIRFSNFELSVSFHLRHYSCLNGSETENDLNDRRNCIMSWILLIYDCNLIETGTHCYSVPYVSHRPPLSSGKNGRTSMGNCSFEYNPYNAEPTFPCIDLLSLIVACDFHDDAETKKSIYKKKTTKQFLDIGVNSTTQNSKE